MSDEKRSEDAETIDDESTKGSGASTPDADVAEAAPPAAAGSEDTADDEDAANPAAIARRLAALGDDDGDELAREEERKLAERRAATKKGKKKKAGLEAAASKKLSRIGERAEPRRSVAVASDADPLIERTAKLGEWAKKNQSLVQIVGAALVVGLLGVAGFLYRDHKREGEASTLLAKAVETQEARIGDARKDDEDDRPDPHFKTYDDRRAAALKQYKDIQARFPGTGAAILARLAEGSLLLDARDAAGALAAYQDVKASPLAAADQEVAGRALEGIGFAHELAAAKDPASKDKELDAALAAYKELESTLDVRGFKELAMYHQARVLMDKGDKDKAKELLLAVKERITRPEAPIAPGVPVPPQFPYLREVAMDRLYQIDPSAAPKAMPPGAGGGMNLSPEQIQRLIEQMKQQKGGEH